MAWEDRSGNRYYYRKRREGQRVVSEYIGRGEVAEFLAEMDELDRVRRLLDREEEREAFERMREEIEASDKMVNEVDETIRALTRAWMVANGFHTHKGQWRRRSDGG